MTMISNEDEEKAKKKFTVLFKKEGINTLPTLYKKLEMIEFKKKFQELIKKYSVLGLTSIGMIIGLKLGGAGIAAMGSAIGIPLFPVFGVIFHLVGRFLKSLGSENIAIPKELYRRLKDIHVSPKEKEKWFLKLPKKMKDIIKGDKSKEKIMIETEIALLIEREIVRLENIEKNRAALEKNKQEKKRILDNIKSSEKSFEESVEAQRKELTTLSKKMKINFKEIKDSFEQNIKKDEDDLGNMKI